MKADRDKFFAPIIYFPIGGLYCSITTVDAGKALVLERRIVNTATAVRD
jgi:hypothetical protein